MSVDPDNIQDLNLLDQELADHYRVYAEIGRGGTSTIYRAEDKFLNRVVAIKVLSAEFRETERERFMREIKILSSLNHPNIVKIFKGGFSKNGQPLLVMEWIEGRSLAEFLAERGKLSPPELSEIFSQILLAIGYAHEQGIIHRDISPANIVLIQEENSITVKLLDFGLARSLLEKTAANQKLTGKGVLLGTPKYMSPEQCKEAELSPQSDLYAIACVLVECLTGTAPFTAETALDLMYKQINEAPDLSRISPSVGLSQLISKCLAKDPKERPASAAEFWQQLAKSLNISSAENRREKRLHEVPKLDIKAACIAALISVIAICSWIIVKNRPGTTAQQTVQQSSDPNMLIQTAESKQRKAIANANAGNVGEFRRLAAECIPLRLRALALIKEKLAANATSENFRTTWRKRCAEHYRALANNYALLGEYTKMVECYKQSIEINSEQSFAVRASIMGLLANRLREGDLLDEEQLYLKDSLSLPMENNAPSIAYLRKAENASQLALSLAKVGKLKESTIFALVCQKILKQNNLEGVAWEAMDDAIVANNFFAEHDPNHMDAYLKDARINLLKEHDDYDDLAAATASLLVGKLLQKTDKSQSQRFLHAAIFDYASRCNINLILPIILDQFGELENNEGNFNEVQSTVQQVLNEERVAATKHPGTEPVCYQLLAQMSYLKGAAANPAEQESFDRNCANFVKSGIAAIKTNYANLNYINQELDLICARLKYRQSKKTRGAEQQRLSTEAKAKFANSVMQLLDRYDYWQRKSVQDGAAEYLRLLTDAGDEASVQKLRRAIEGKTYWPKLQY